jgi:transcriptional regulator GlxA family with amidase domain
VLLDWFDKGTIAAAACTGTFIAGAATVLDGQQATTAWWLGAAFRERFPEVDLDENRMVVDCGQVVTTGAALAHMDLALWLIRGRSPTLADLVARYLVLEPRPSQAPFIVPGHVQHNDPLIARFERWARQNLAKPFSLHDAARAIGTSERSLERRFRQTLGKTPVSFVQDLRVELAVHQLRTTDQSIDEIAAAVGYGDGVTLRTLLRKKLGKGIRELRRAA